MKMKSIIKLFEEPPRNRQYSIDGWMDRWIDGPAKVDLEREREKIFLIKNPQTLLSIKNKRIASPPLKICGITLLTISLIIDKIIRISINQLNLMPNNVITESYYARRKIKKKCFAFLSRFLYRQIKGTNKIVANEAKFQHPFFRDRKREEKRSRESTSSLISSRFSRRQDVVSIYDPPKSRPPCQAPRVSLFCLPAHFCTFKTFFAAANFIIRARVRTSRATPRAIRNEVELAGVVYAAQFETLLDLNRIPLPRSPGLT